MEDLLLILLFALFCFIFGGYCVASVAIWLMEKK